MGFLAPIVLQSKMILQSSYREPSGWDDVLKENVRVAWNNWKTSVKALNTLTIPRCFKPVPTLPCNIQLHTFSDASQFAFGAVAYLRMEFENEDIQVAFVMAKFRLSPLKGLTIPRLE